MAKLTDALGAAAVESVRDGGHASDHFAHSMNLAQALWTGNKLIGSRTGYDHGKAFYILGVAKGQGDDGDGVGSKRITRDAPAAVARHTGNAAVAAQHSQQELGGGEGAGQPVRPAGKLQWMTTKPPAPADGGLRRISALAAPACRPQQQRRHGRLESACATVASRRGAPAPCHSSALLTPNVAKETTCAPHAAAPPLPHPLARLRPHRRQSCAALARRAGGAGAPRSRGARSISPPPESPHNGRCRHVGRAAASSHRRIGGRKAAHRRLTKSAAASGPAGRVGVS